MNRCRSSRQSETQQYVRLSVADERRFTEKREDQRSALMRNGKTRLDGFVQTPLVSADGRPENGLSFVAFWAKRSFWQRLQQFIRSGINLEAT